MGEEVIPRLFRCREPTGETSVFASTAILKPGSAMGVRVIPGLLGSFTPSPAQLPSRALEPEELVHRAAELAIPRHCVTRRMLGGGVVRAHVAAEGNRNEAHRSAPRSSSPTG